MKVKAVREHQNRYGEDFEKKVGAEYNLPDSEAKRLIRRGLVEKIDEVDAEDNRPAGRGTGAGGTSESDGKERSAQDGKEGAGADAGKGGKSGAT